MALPARATSIIRVQRIGLFCQAPMGALNRALTLPPHPRPMRPLAILLCLLPGLSLAGPWPRAAGSAFLFTAHEIGSDGAADGWSALYAELGLPRDWTLTLDAGGHLARAAGGAPPDGRLALTLGRPVLSSDADRAARPGWLEPWRMALEAGLGFERDAEGDDTVRAVGGLSVGRGLSSRWGDGWTTATARLAVGGGRAARVNLGLGAGLRPRPRLTVEMGVFAERDDDWSAALAPAASWDLGPLGRPRAALLLRGDPALQLGWTREF